MVDAARQRAERARVAFREHVDGLVVAFTGGGGHPKDVREGLALKYRMTPKTRVTKDTRLLVIGSDDVENQQTSLARERGIPIMLEAAFWQRLGATVPRTSGDSRQRRAHEQAIETPLGFTSADSRAHDVGIGTFEGRACHEWSDSDAITQLRREGRVRDAERILVGCIQASESQSEMTGQGVAPAYYEQLAILYSKQKMAHDELAVLERFAAQRHAPGATPARLMDRRDKVLAKVADDRRGA